MANFTLRTENWCCSPRHINPQSSISNYTHLKHTKLNFIFSKPNTKLRIFLSSVKGKGDVVEGERIGVRTGLRVAESDKTNSISVPEEDDQPQPSSNGSLDEGFSLKWPPWKDLPLRYKLIGTTSLAFVICNMDKVNLSIAIIPMSHQFGWNSATAGLVQSSFFWGYALSQLPGGWLAKIFGGRKILEIGVLMWSVATVFVPFAAGYLPGLVLSRILVGIGEGVSPSAATDLIARSIPVEERSRAVAFVFGGLSVGSVAGLLLAPSLIQTYGWESVFYIFGSIGIIWCLGFQFIEGQSSFAAEFTSRKAQNIASGPLTTTSGTKSLNTSLKEMNGSLKDVPWKAFFQSEAVWAMIYAHFCGSWGHYTCLSWLPTYFSTFLIPRHNILLQVWGTLISQIITLAIFSTGLLYIPRSEALDLNLTEAAWVSVLPPLASIVVNLIASQVADNLISTGVETTKVRKICQTIAFLSPAACMILSSLDLGLPPWEIVALLTGGLALSSFALSGLYCTHQDISPEYASILLGITNTVGAVPGIVGVALTGYLLDSTHSWSISLFAPSIFFYLTGTIVWLKFASSKPQNFE